MAVDPAGNLYIVDGGNLLVRKVSPAGIITTVAGNGEDYIYSGDGGPATSAGLDPDGVAVGAAGNLYITDSIYCHIRKVSPTGIITSVAGTYCEGYEGDGGPKTNAQFDSPLGIAIDARRDVYVADSENDAVRLLRPVEHGRQRPVIVP